MKAHAKASGGATVKVVTKAPVDPQRIVAADFLAGAGPGSDLPAPTHAEIAFGGRSNVGKSSLINTLVERQSLVRTWRTRRWMWTCSRRSKARTRPSSARAAASGR